MLGYQWTGRLHLDARIYNEVKANVTNSEVGKDTIRTLICVSAMIALIIWPCCLGFDILRDENRRGKVQGKYTQSSDPARLLHIVHFLAEKKLGINDCPIILKKLLYRRP